MARIRLLVAEDHVLVREGSRLLLEREPDMAVVAETSDGREAVRLAGLLRPDVAVLDVRMPGLNGIAATAEIRSASPHTRVLILSAYDDEEYVTEALAAGACGYLSKSAPSRELVQAVRTVAGGQLALGGDLALKVARWWAARQGSRGLVWPQPLTARENEVLSYVARGFQNKEIAANLHLSVKTVEAHVSNILGKLGASSRTEAAVYAMARGWFARDGEGHEAQEEGAS